jgi:hypothetical protein
MSAPPWVGKALVVCENGPRAGSWHFLDHGPGSWLELRRLAEFNHETPETGRTLGYVTTTRKQAHPRWGVEGAVLTWAP